MGQSPLRHPLHESLTLILLRPVSPVLSIDLSGLAQAAMDEVFAQPVVGLFPPSQLVCNSPAQHLLDFYTISQQVRVRMLLERADARG